MLFYETHMTQDRYQKWVVLAGIFVGLALAMTGIGNIRFMVLSWTTNGLIWSSIGHDQWRNRRARQEARKLQEVEAASSSDSEKQKVVV